MKRILWLLSFCLFISGGSLWSQQALEEVILRQMGRCETQSLPTILPLPNKQGYFISANDSTWVSYPDEVTYTMKKEDLLKERSRDFSIFFHYQNTLYLTHGGGGVVYSFDGSELKREDESFYHQNQYGALPFEYEGSFYLFGGSGLFSRKNFITRYDHQAREWLLQKTSGQKPSFGKHMAGMVVGNGFYVLAEHVQEEEQRSQDLSQQEQRNFSIYHLNFRTWEWKLRGTVPKDIVQDLLAFKYDTFAADTNLMYLNGPSGFFALDFVSNQITKYDNDYPLLKNIKILSLDDDGIRYIYCDSSQFVRTGYLSMTELSKNRVYTKELYRANLNVYYNTLLQVIGVLFFITVVLILINELKFENRLVIRVKSGLVMYRSRTIKVLVPVERTILLSLAEDGVLSFSALEDIVSLKDDSQAVRIKKRDRALRILNEKIATIFNHQSDERDDYLKIETGLEDKRSRSLGLNPNYFKIM